MFSVMDGSAMGVLERADLFAASTDAFGSAEELARHVPMGCQTMAVEASFRWSELRRWEVVRIIEPEQSTCRIIFSGEDGRPSITLSSELLELEAVENLARELQGSNPV